MRAIVVPAPADSEFLHIMSYKPTSRPLDTIPKGILLCPPPPPTDISIEPIATNQGVHKAKERACIRKQLHHGVTDRGK